MKCLFLNVILMTVLMSQFTNIVKLFKFLFIWGFLFVFVVVFLHFTAYPCNKTITKITSQHSGIIVHALGPKPCMTLASQ